MPTFAQTAAGYRNLYARMQIRPERLATARAIAERLSSNRERYANVASQISCPWWLIAVIHELECGGNFSRHLHNGDPLSRRTVRVPAGRPASGSPPFTWEYSAADALRSHGAHSIRDWTVARALHFLEGYNGWGYFGKICTPYLWSFSTHYRSGKIIRDHGPIEMSVVSQQCGAAVLIKLLLENEPQPKGDAMQELKDFLRTYEPIAAGIVKATDTRFDDLLLDMFAEALGIAESSPGNNSPDVILSALKLLVPSKRAEVLGKVEAAIRPFLPVEVQPVAEAKPTMVSVEPPSAPVVTSPIDQLLGGSKLVGYKTLLGIVLLVALKVLVASGVAPWLPVAFLEPLIEGLIGAGLVAKVDRFLALLGK